MDKELLEALGKILDEKLDEKFDEKLDPIKNEILKDSLLLEDINNKVEVLVEAQTAFKEQLERAKDKNGNTLADR